MEDKIPILNYFMLNRKVTVKNEMFNLIFYLIDTIITLMKFLNTYKLNYDNSSIISSIKFFKFYTYIESNSVKFFIVLGYIILTLILYEIYKFKNNLNMSIIDSIVFNIFEFLFFKLFLIFYAEFIFSMTDMYLFGSIIINIPFFIIMHLILINCHISGFTPKFLSFPLDDFSEMIGIMNLYIKLFIGISGATKVKEIAKICFIFGFIFQIYLFIYLTYLIFFKSYYLMSNEFLSKSKYSFILSTIICEIFILFAKNDEILEFRYIVFYICVFLFCTVFIQISYDPYFYILIDTPNNPENAIYYLFLIDNNKNILFYLHKKILNHITKCNRCSLCNDYNKYQINKIEFQNESPGKDLFNILYNGDDKYLTILYEIICDYKINNQIDISQNAYYSINLLYLCYLKTVQKKTAEALNIRMLYLFIQNSNQLTIQNNEISIKQLLLINQFMISFKKIIMQIKGILNKTNLKKYLDKFFNLCDIIPILETKNFNKYIYRSKTDGTVNTNFMISICSLLYEELFNITISNSGLSIRENTILYEDLFNQYQKQNNQITLSMNLLSRNCKIIYAGRSLYEKINTSFYNLFAEKLKINSIVSFNEKLLSVKDELTNNNKNSNQKNKYYLEENLLIKEKINDVVFYKVLLIKVNPLFNSNFDKNILLSGTYSINENVIITNSNLELKNEEQIEKICGYGNKNIMSSCIKSKFLLSNLKNSEFMKNKILNLIFEISSNQNLYRIYSLSILQKSKKYSSKLISKINSIVSNSKIEKEELIEDLENINDNKKEEKNINELNLLDECNSQSSEITKVSDKIGLNFHGPAVKTEEDSFSSKGFLYIQFLLEISLFILFILMGMQVFSLKMIKKSLFTYNSFYYKINELIRITHQFSFSFPAVICIAKNKNSTICDNYVSSLDSANFNQTLYLIEYNKILAEMGLDAITTITQGITIINYKELSNFFVSDIIFYTLNMEIKNGNVIFYRKENKMTFTENLLLLGNIMNIISNKLTRDPIFLLSGEKSRFDNMKLITNLDDFRTSVYNFLLNYDDFVSNMETAGKIIKVEIDIKVYNIEKYFKYFHNVIFIVMIIQIIIIFIYLIVFDQIVSEIINYIILKFDTTYDSENDFQRLYNIKISQIETLLQIYTCNPIMTLNAMNKNCSKYKTFENARKKEEQRTNMNKNKISNEKKYKILFNKEKYVKWHEILISGQNNLYIIFTVIIFIVDVIIYAAIYLCFTNYFAKRDILLSLVDDSWNNEKNIYAVVNYYQTMLLYNMTMDELTEKYYVNTEQKTIIDKIENSLYSILTFKKEQSTIPNLYRNFCYFLGNNCDCESLINYYMNDKTFTLYKTIEVMENNHKTFGLKNIFVHNCVNSHFIVDGSGLPAFQSLYQKCINAIVSLNDFSYEGLINKLFHRDFLVITIIFLNGVDFITNIFGKVSYTDARMNLFSFLDENIYLSLGLYCVSEAVLILIFIIIYVWKMNNKCRNMWKLKKMFQITDFNKL